MRTYSERLANIKAKAVATKKAYGAMAVSVTAMVVLVVMICGVALGPMVQTAPAPTDGPGLMQPTMSEKNPTGTTDTPTEPIVTEPADPQPTNTTHLVPTEPTQPIQPPIPTEPPEPQEPREPETVVHSYLIEMTYQSGSKKPTVTTYARDEYGNLIPEGYTAVYDDQGRIAKLTNQEGNKILYTYDSYGNLLREESFANGYQTGLEEYAYFYDTLGRVTEKTYIQRTTQFRIEYTYHDSGKIATEHTYSNDVLTGEYTYNEAGWLDKYVKYNSATGDKVYSETYHHSETTSTARRVNPEREVLATITYTYDEYGNVVKKSVLSSDKTLTTYTYTYLYVTEDLGIRVDYSADIDSGPGGIREEETLVLRSMDDLADRFGTDSEIYGRFTNAFFEKNTLIYVTFAEFTGMARHQVTGIWKDEDGNYCVSIDRIHPEPFTEDSGHGSILIMVNERIPADAGLTVEDTRREWSYDAWNRLYGNVDEGETEVILPQRPEDYELEFWIGENVTDVNWDRYACYVDGETVDLYMAKGYKWHTDDRGNKFFPVAYVYYEVTTLADGRKFITEITIADPDIKVHGVGMNSTKERFQAVFAGLGYAVEQYGTSNGVHIATSNGVSFLHHYYEEIIISVESTNFVRNDQTESSRHPLIVVQNGQAYVVGAYDAINGYSNPNDFLYDGKSLSEYYGIAEDAVVTSTIIDLSRPLTFYGVGGSFKANAVGMTLRGEYATGNFWLKLQLDCEIPDGLYYGSYSDVEIWPDEVTCGDQMITVDMDFDGDLDTVKWAFEESNGVYACVFTVERDGQSMSFERWTEFFGYADVQIIPVDINRDGYMELIIYEKMENDFDCGVSVYGLDFAGYIERLNYIISSMP